MTLQTRMWWMFLLLFIAFRSIFNGVFDVVTGIRYRKLLRGEWFLIIGGLLSVLFGFLVLSFPFTGALAIVWLIASFAIVYGALQFALAYEAHEWGKHEHPTTMPSPA